MLRPESEPTSAAIIFDLDGVLIDSEALQYRAYSQVLARFGVAVSLPEYAQHWIAAGRGPEYAVATYGLAVTAAELRALKHPVYDEILRREITLMLGAIEAVARLSAHFPLALATNSNRSDVDFVLDRFGLRNAFTAIVAREDYARAKPEPDAFLTAAARLGTAPRSCVVIEDAYKGVLAAQRAGAHVIAVPNLFTRENDFSLAAAVVGSLDEVTVPLVQSVLSRSA